MNVIECHDLSKHYIGTNAVHNLTFTLTENKMTGLIGRNGAGKSTLLKMIAGYIRRSSGDIKVFSEEPFNNLKVSANVMLIDDAMHMPPTLNLGELLNNFKEFYPNWDDDLANRLMDYFSLQRTRFYSSLSKGMKSTFNMIVGLAVRCPLTLFDEPTTGMDAAVRKDFYRALLKDYIDHPRTIIISSHLLNEIEDILEDILLIKDGQKHLYLPIEQLKDYAVGLRGSLSDLEQVIRDREILHQTAISEHHGYVVVRNNSSQLLCREAAAHHLEVTPVSANDVCVYLTNKTKGGIDDVFNRG